MIEAQHINSHIQPSWMQQNPFTAQFRTSDDDDLASESFYNFAPQLLFGGWQAEAADGDAAMTMDSMATDSPVQASMDRSYHRRAPSNSTIASSYGSNSPYPQAAGLPFSAPSTAFDNALSFDSSAAFERQPQHHGFSTFSKQGHLPTPSHTPTQDTFSLESQQKPFGSDGTYRPQQQPRSSVMPAHDLPQTPQTSVVAEGSNSYNGLTTAMSSGVNVPKFNRTMSDVYQDELYDPSAYTATQPIIQQNRQHGSRQPQLLSPYRNMVNERLQAANDFRASNSPPGTDLRRKSPFRESSTYARASRQYGPVSGEQQQTSSPMSWRGNPNETEKTISPKDAVLDYHEPANNGTPPSLFPETQDAQPQFGNTPFQIPTSSFEFQAPSIPASVQQSLQRPQPYRTQSNASTISNFPTDDYPAHLIHMETSRSEPDGAGGSHDISRASSVYSISDVERPPRSTADSGTYTCTYHGCTLRFATPALLQKHKREGHRAAATALKTQGGLRGGSRPRSLSPATSGVDLASAATSSPRNTSSPNSPHPHIAPAPTSSQSPSQLHPSQMSQHGPHRCDRINPSTGKPCNTVFSRPYDLTRHEDTIHARRTKVRCQYCVEEKTFSRSDALTRHMRVVHPEIVAAMGGENARRRGRGRKTGGD